MSLLCVFSLTLPRSQQLLKNKILASDGRQLTRSEWDLTQRQDERRDRNKEERANKIVDLVVTQQKK